MELKNVKIGFGVTGSHCTLNRVFLVMKSLKEDYGAVITPIFSPSVQETSTRFGVPEKWFSFGEAYGEDGVLTTINETEPIGPKNLLDIMVIAPCSGNTLAKLNQGIVDTPVLMAAKAHLRNNKPLVLAISTNDGLGLNGKNIGNLLNCKNIYFVPFGQDDPEKKPRSLVANMEILPKTIISALKSQQIQPILIEYHKEM